MAALPNAEQLGKLTLRAIAAYTVRAARRGSTILRGVVEDDVIESPLRIAERLVYSRDLRPQDASEAALSAVPVATAMATLRTPQLKAAALCLTRTAMATAAAFLALRAADSERAKRQLDFAAKQAADCARGAAYALGGDASAAAVDAARADYEMLSKISGEHQVVVLGDPIDVSDERWRV